MYKRQAILPSQVVEPSDPGIHVLIIGSIDYRDISKALEKLNRETFITKYSYI